MKSSKKRSKIKKTKSKGLKIIEKPEKPKSLALNKAYKLLEYGIDSVNNLYELYHKRGERVRTGAPYQQDQDILRSMLVMAGATLDSSIKRVIESSYQTLMRTGDKSKEYARKYVIRKIVKNLDKEGADHLAEVLLSDRPADIITKHIIDDSTGESLQSMSKIYEVSDMLGVALKGHEKFTEDDLRDAFDARNEIVHEMDAQLKKKGWHRRRRKKDDIFRYSRLLLDVTEMFLHSVDSRLS